MSIATENRELCKSFRFKCAALLGRNPYSSRSINKGRTYRVSIPFDHSLRYTSWKGKITEKQIAKADAVLNILEQEMPANCYITYTFHVGACLYISFRLDVRS